MNPLLDPRLVVWLGLLLLGTLVTARSATLDPNYAPQLDGLVRHAVAQPDGKSIVTGNFRNVNNASRPGIARLSSNGSLDASFAPDLGASPWINAVALAPDGSVFIAGRFDAGGQPASLAHLNSAGQLLAAWNGVNGPNAAPAALAVDSNGNLLIGGSFTSFAGAPALYVARITPGGELDATFQSSLEQSPAMEAGVTALAVQGNAIVVGGVFNLAGTSGKLARLTSAGAVDASFTHDAGSILYAHAIEARGNALLIAGQTSESGFCSISGSGPVLAPSGVVWSLAAQADGSVIAGGQFQQIGGIARGNLARISGDGIVDASFNVSCDQPVYAVSTQADGSVLIGGGFQTVNGAARTFLARLLPASGPKFSSITCDAQSHFCTVLKTEAGAQYAIEASADLRNWTLISTVLATSGQTAIEAPTTAGARQQFFRARRM